MEISKEWNGETVENKVWARPGEESCFYAKKWKEEGKKTILDLGSGLGRHSIFFAKHGFRVTAVERSQYGVHFLKEWQKREGVDILVKKTDMSHLRFQITLLIVSGPMIRQRIRMQRASKKSLMRSNGY